jgi:Rrf2 family protein
MLSDTAEYALRAVLFIADREEAGRVNVETVASSLDVPRNYLSKTLHILARNGILDSARGPNGGFRLAIPADRLTLARIVEIFDGDRARRTCLLGRQQCGEANPCPAHHRWKNVADKVSGFFRSTTIADLLQDPSPLVPVP